MTRAFIKNYRDGVVEFKNLRVTVDEESIVEAIGVPTQGEKWFKQQYFQGNYDEFLLPGFEKLDWKNGIHVSKIKPNWKIPLEMVQNYITCEGRYDRILKCHLRLLMHLNGSLKLNLPFYLLKSLQKMVTCVQTHPEHTAHSIYHQGLIKLLLFSHLSKEGRSWEIFLFELGFEEKVKEKGKKAAEDLNQQTEKHEE